MMHTQMLLTQPQCYDLVCHSNITNVIVCYVFHISQKKVSVIHELKRGKKGGGGGAGGRACYWTIFGRTLLAQEVVGMLARLPKHYRKKTRPDRGWDGVVGGTS